MSLSARVLTFAAALPWLFMLATAQAAELVPRFVLQDTGGRSVTERGFRGDYVLIFFGYTHCPDVCTTTLLEVGNALRLLEVQGAAVRAVFVTLDPVRDTPARLREYLGHFHPRIEGLSGSPAQLRAAAHAFRLTYGYTVDGRDVDAPPDGRDDYLVYHGSQLYLLAPDGELVDVFGFASGAGTIVEGVRQAMNEASR